jgi:RNA polymerase sigma-70 factor, ECF subfamily
METDIKLLAAAREMNGDALMRLFDHYAPALFKYAFRLSNSAVMADQIVGDVFANLFEHLSAGLGPITNLRLYLYEMAYRIFVDEVRYSHRSAPIEAVGLTYTDGYSTHGSTENRVLLEIVRRAIMNDLTQDQRHVIILRFLEGFSLKETALIIGKKVGNVKVIQNRAITALRRALDYQVVDIGTISFMIRSMSHT